MNGFDEIFDLQHQLLNEIKSIAVDKLEEGISYRLGATFQMSGDILADGFEVEDLSNDNYDIYIYCEEDTNGDYSDSAPGLYLYDLSVYQLSWFLDRLRTEKYHQLTSKKA